MVEVPGYRVLRELGRGGMATVWLAVQESLHREVALKVLSADMARDAEFTERFLREARLVASLHHKHIVQVYDVGTHDGHAYLAMEYLPQGAITPLAGKVDAATALDCVAQIAGALDYGHARGIVHRDVKLENILRHEDGSFTLSDFGIARVSGAATVRTLQGLTLGTPHYMSPERWTGSAFDGRADLYSLGVVLHALLTGRLPYDGVEEVLALGNLHREAPIPLLPAQYGRLQGLLARLMAKRPEDRHPNGAAVVEHVEALRREGAAADASISEEAHRLALKRTSALLRDWPFGSASGAFARETPWWRGGRALAAALLVAIGAAVAWAAFDLRGRTPAAAAAGDTSSVAVLPFQHLAADVETSQIAGVLADELVTQLAGYPGLSVTTPATLDVKQRSLGVRELGRALGVAHALETTMRRDGANLVLSVRLLDTASGFHEWAETYTRPAGDIWRVQQELAARVAASLLSQQELARANVARPAGEALALFLRGKQQLALPPTDATLAAAQKLFEAALAEDPAFARAQAGICRTETRRFELKRDPAAYDRAQTACTAALRGDADSSEVALAQGDLSRLHGDHAAAVEAFERAAQDPLLRPAAYGGLAKTYAAAGQDDRAESYFRQSRSLQPGNWRAHADVGNFYLARNRYAAAIEAYRNAIALSPELPPSLYNNLGAAYLFSDDFAAAAEMFERSIAINPSVSALGNLGTARFHLQRYEDAAAAYERALVLSPDDYIAHGNLGDALSQVPGKAEEARQRYARAAQLAEAALARRQDARDVAALLAWYLANVGEGARALELVAGASRADGSTATIEHRIAEVYARLGMPDEAREHAERAIRLGLSRRMVMTPWLVRAIGSGSPTGDEEST